MNCIRDARAQIFVEGTHTHRDTRDEERPLTIWLNSISVHYIVRIAFDSILIANINLEWNSPLSATTIPKLLSHNEFQSSECIFALFYCLTGPVRSTLCVLRLVWMRTSSSEIGFSAFNLNFPRMTSETGRRAICIASLHSSHNSKCVCCVGCRLTVYLKEVCIVLSRT